MNVLILNVILVFDDKIQQLREKITYRQYKQLIKKNILSSRKFDKSNSQFLISWGKCLDLIFELKRIYCSAAELSLAQKSFHIITYYCITKINLISFLSINHLNTQLKVL